MNFKQYIAESERVYNYRLKTVIPLDDEAMDRLETAILKYQPVDISRPVKTMLQKNPLDFPNVSAAEIYICDLTLALPASSYIIQNEIRTALDAIDSHVIVRDYNDPTEVESERLVALSDMDAEAREDGLSPRGLLTDPHYNEASPKTPDLYGGNYNSKFLNYLRKVEKEEAETRKVDATNSLFSWMDLPKQDVPDDDGAYNKNIAGAPTLGNSNGEFLDTGASHSGAMVDNKRSYKRLYGKNGERSKNKMLTREVDTLKAPK